MFPTPGPAEQLSWFKDCRERAKIKETLSRHDSNYLNGIVDAGSASSGYLKFRQIIKGYNPLNYGESKIFLPFEEYSAALGLLIERDLENVSLVRLKEESATGSLDWITDRFLPFEKSLKKNVAVNVLRKRAPKGRQLELF